MSALSDLRDKYVLDAASITDAVDRLEILALIEQWYPIRVRSDANAAKGLQSYSASGRSDTRKDDKQHMGIAAQIEAQIKGALYGRGVSHADFRYPVDVGVQG